MTQLVTREMQVRSPEPLDLAAVTAGTRAAESPGVHSTNHKPGRTVRITEEMEAVDIAQLQLDEVDEVTDLDLEAVTGGFGTTTRPPIQVAQPQWGKLLPFLRPGSR